MTIKRVIHPNRIRKTPKQFSWIDGCFVREGYPDKCKHSDASLYLFLIRRDQIQEKYFNFNVK